MVVEEAARRGTSGQAFIHQGLGTTLVGLVTVNVQITVITPLIHWFYVCLIVLYFHIFSIFVLRVLLLYFIILC